MKEEFDPKKILDTGEWEMFIARPFSLFVCSVWHYCYKKFILEITGDTVSIPNAIFLQEQNGVVRNYRRSADLQAVAEVYERYVANDRDAILSLFAQAKKYNTQAEQYIAEGDSCMVSLQEQIDTACRVAIFGAVAPRFAMDAVEKLDADFPEMMQDFEDLRSVTYYPKLIIECIMPRVRALLEKHAVPDVEHAQDLLLFDELLQEDFSAISERQKSVQNGNHFIYICDQDKVSLTWHDSTEEVIGESTIVETSVVGQTAFGGNVTGKAHVCVTLDGSDVIDFQKGDILVSINSSPNVMHLINDAGAIITDEGGIICHAAIVSRELKIPCVIGTKNATKVFKTGDQVEVDADNGVVKILPAEGR